MQAIFEAEEISWQLLLDAEQAFYNREYGYSVETCKYSACEQAKKK